MAFRLPLTAAVVLALLLHLHRLRLVTSAQSSSTFLFRRRLTERVFLFYSLRAAFQFSSLGVKCPFRDEVRLQGQLSKAKPRIFRGDAPGDRCKPRRRTQRFMGICPMMMRSSTIPLGLCQRIRRFPSFLSAQCNSLSTSFKNSSAFRGFSQERFQDLPL
jgi:hypothetical protein